MALRYLPHVTRARDENGRRDVGYDGKPIEAWDIETNPYRPHSNLRRPKFHQAMEVCALLGQGVPEEELAFTFEGFCGLLDLVIAEVKGEFSDIPER